MLGDNSNSNRLRPALSASKGFILGPWAVQEGFVTQRFHSSSRPRSLFYSLRLAQAILFATLAAATAGSASPPFGPLWDSSPTVVTNEIPVVPK